MTLGIILGILLFPMVAFGAGEPTINWEQLGTVDQQTTFYPEGATFNHPAGTTYIRQNGNWVLQTNPVRSVPEPGSWLLMGAGIVAVGVWVKWKR